MPSLPSTFRTPEQTRAREEAIARIEQQRGTARQRGYSARWDREAIAHRRAHPLCVGCLAVNRVTAAEVTDHVVPHKGDMRVFWDRSRWQSACGWHHSVVKQQLEAMFAAGTIAADELWLNSKTAIALTMKLDGVGGG